MESSSRPRKEVELLQAKPILEKPPKADGEAAIDK
jgi:hypothetical protein